MIWTAFVIRGSHAIKQVNAHPSREGHFFHPASSWSILREMVPLRFMTNTANFQITQKTLHAESIWGWREVTKINVKIIANNYFMPYKVDQIMIKFLRLSLSLYLLFGTWLPMRRLKILQCDLSGLSRVTLSDPQKFEKHLYSEFN